jgi:predicted RNA-binding protein YlxR (DUF448 family)
MDDDATAVAEEKGPERTCIVTREKGEPDRLIRFVVGPDGAVTPDIRARLPGRGAWLTGTAAVLQLAIKRKAFARAFKREVAADAALAGQVDDLLQRDALQALAFANKAGHVICGAAKVEAALGKGSVACLLHAVDGSADGVRKIEAAARRAGFGDADRLVRVQIFESRQLDLALGRSNVIHAALLAGGVTNSFLSRAARLERFRGESQQKSTDPVGEAALGLT